MVWNSSPLGKYVVSPLADDVSFARNFLCLFLIWKECRDNSAASNHMCDLTPPMQNFSFTGFICEMRIIERLYVYQPISEEIMKVKDKKVFWKTKKMPQERP